MRAKLWATATLAIGLLLLLPLRAQAAIVDIRAQVAGLDTTTASGEVVYWAGGVLTGQVEVVDTPYFVFTNPATGDSHARHSFSGSLKLNGTAIDLTSQSFFVVFDNFADPDSFSLRLYMNPLSVASNLQLIALDLTKLVAEELSLGTLPDFNSLTYIPNAYDVYSNIKLTPSGPVYGVVGDTFQITEVPEPSTLACAALGLTALGFTRRRRQQPA